MLDSSQKLKFNHYTILKCTLKSSPCSDFSTVRLGGLDYVANPAYPV